MSNASPSSSISFPLPSSNPHGRTSRPRFTCVAVNAVRTRRELGQALTAAPIGSAPRLSGIEQGNSILNHGACECVLTAAQQMDPSSEWEKRDEGPELPLAVVVGAGNGDNSLGARPRSSSPIADRTRPLRKHHRRLRQEGHDATGHQCDVTNTDQVEELAEKAAAWAGSLARTRRGPVPGMADWSMIMAVSRRDIGRAAFFPGFARRSAINTSMAGHMAKMTPETLVILDDPLASGSWSQSPHS